MRGKFYDRRLAGEKSNALNRHSSPVLLYSCLPNR
jgi:hypothetical protein